MDSRRNQRRSSRTSRSSTASPPPKKESRRLYDSKHVSQRSPTRVVPSKRAKIQVSTSSNDSRTPSPLSIEGRTASPPQAYTPPSSDESRVATPNVPITPTFIASQCKAVVTPPVCRCHTVSPLTDTFLNTTASDQTGVIRRLSAIEERLAQFDPILETFKKAEGAVKNFMMADSELKEFLGKQETLVAKALQEAQSSCCNFFGVPFETQGNLI